MVISTVVGTSLTLNYDDDKSFTYSNIKLTSSDESIYELAQAINSIQDKTIETIKKSVTSELVNED